MHKGVFMGINAAKQDKRILILGESHHISNDPESKNRTFGVPATYTTADVVEEHLNMCNQNSLEFFKKIGNSFGLPMESAEQRAAFWHRVYFGNYIDVLCGVGDAAAKKYLKEEGKRREMNDALFDFVNEMGIDVIVCFGRLVYDNLPSLNKKHKACEDIGIITDGLKIGGRSDYIKKCIYLPDIDHANTSVLLKKELSVYSLRHPSGKGGFRAENYSDVLAKLLKESDTV